MITLEINVDDIKICLHKFGVVDPIKEWRLLADGPDHPVPYEVVRKIVYLELENGEKYVMKFVREPIFTTRIIEKQSAFSDLLMDNGIKTPKRKMVDGCYCISFEKEKLVMDVYIEEWVGEKIPQLTMKLYKNIGSVIGKIHKISQYTGFQIGFSLLYNEITERDTSFSRLWRNGNQSVIPQKQYEEILEIYNRRLAVIKRIWSKLPRAAVQGDIYSCNNIAEKDGTLVVYDFNLAGDEVLIGDILQCWFRTIFDKKIEDDLALLSQDEMWSEFILAYQSQRTLTNIEKKYFPDVYAILGVVYYSKLMNYWIDKGERLRAQNNYSFLMELLKTQKLPYVN